jgi:osmotically-inducible protein OsmY
MYLSKKIFLLLISIFLSISTGVFAQNEDLDDTDIMHAIETELKTEQSVSAHLIDVMVNEGIVTLSGSVDNLLACNKAVSVARSIKGVRSVVNNVEVKPVSRSDAQIKQDVENAILQDPATETYSIGVAVEDGRVTLTGSVDSWAERELAEKVAMGVKGIKKIINEISIDYKEDRSDADIKDDVRRRLETSSWIDHAQIDVQVTDDVVYLSGAVGSAAERHYVQSLAWVNGVKAVNIEELNVEWWAKDTLQRETQFLSKSDIEIKDAVKDALLYDPTVKQANVDVRVKDGVVELSGKVSSLRAKNSAETDAKNTIGVYRVKNYLRVRPEDELSDVEIANKVKKALFLDPVIERYSIHVIAMNGKVYLTGRIGSMKEKDYVEKVASRQKGVVEVENELEVVYNWEPKRDRAIKEDVEQEFFWSPYVDGDDITVSVENGMVTLTGTVDTRHEEISAIENAYEGGARTVKNDLDVDYDFGFTVPETLYGVPYY